MKLRSGELAAEVLAEVNAHLSTCLSCRARMSESSTESKPDSSSGHATPSTNDSLHPAPELEKGTAVGRYRILEKLGAGAMGVVYGALDTELERRVALKFVRWQSMERAPEKARANVLREAQAMARVSHPNVVAIYDVGTFHEHVFLAMAQVENQTLGDWLKATPRTWRQVLSVFLAAGRGLAAAHDAGVVHGDFKPGNVLVDSRGRVHVTDFGLARLASSPGEDLPRDSGASSETGSSSLRGGTPAYMAPELLSGPSHAGPLSDQFSFCMALHEGLHGTRPSASPPASSHVPPWLRAVMLRGLAPAPAERFPSMAALLAALQKGSLHPWRRPLQLAGAAALLAIAVGLTHAVHLRSPWACEGAREELDNVWGPRQRTTIQAAFLATDRPYALAAWGRVLQELEAYGNTWVAERTVTCEATHAPHAQPPEQAAWRMRCLDNRLADLSALTQLLSQADGKTVDAAHRAAQSLPSLAGCVRPHTPEGEAEPAGPPKDQAALQATLAKGRALLATGRYAEGVALIEPAALLAKKTGHRQGVAESSLLLGELLEGAGRWRGAEAALFDALDAAEATRLDALATRAWILLVRVSCIGLDEYDKAALWKERATAALERLGDGHPLARIQLLTYTGTLLRMQRDYVRAEVQQEDALLLAERTFGASSLEVADVLLELGATQWRSLQLAKARTTLDRAAEIARRVLGPEHPEFARIRLALVPVLWEAAQLEPSQTRGNSAQAQEGLELGERIARESLGILERSLGPEHPRVYDALNDLGTTLTTLERPLEALPIYERALTIAIKTDGAESQGVAVIRSNLGWLYNTQTEYERAREHFLRVIAIREKLHGPRDAELVHALRMVARSYGKRGLLEEALPHSLRASDIQSSLPDDVAGLWTLTQIDLGQLYLGLRRYDEAISQLEKAVAGWDKARPLSGQRAEVLFLLARALGESGKDPKRALRLASEARRRASLDDPSPRVVRTINAWLEENTRR
ncbi:tetratricopeptide repeat-containing serine/threonine-protein kinase [Myxococcus stipitatus]|nr:tetratricopeptide repeat-containing serine/threonine-protein kinase [Myxococcus stipitatus]